MRTPEGNEVTEMDSIEQVELTEEGESEETMDIEDRLSVGKFDFG